MNIRNMNDLSLSYELLAIWEKSAKEATDKAHLEKALEKIMKHKKAIRAFTNRPESNYRTIKGEYDYKITLERLPEWANSCNEEYLREWFEENRYIEAMPSMYDCTGQAFTSWYKFCKRRGNWYVYHFISFDL